MDMYYSRGVYNVKCKGGQDTINWAQLCGQVDNKSCDRLKQMPIPKPDQKKITETASWKNKGLSNRAIGRVMKRDERQIRRWVAYARAQDLLISADK